jgi:hypothetical protein
MIAKELNAVLADDKQREQWLKRILPGLVITVIYFVFVSNTLMDKTNKAELAYMALVRQGIDAQALSGMQERNASLQNELIQLKQKNLALQDSLSKTAGFLYGRGDEFETVEQIDQLMKKHGLQVSEFQKQPDKKVAELPHALADLKKWLSDMLNKDESVRVYRFVFIGNYVDVYQALREIALGGVRTLPLYISMKDIDDKDGRHSGRKSWTLDFWI